VRRFGASTAPRARAQLDFDVDVRVNVFEASIRLLGGLLSAHLLAAAPGTGPALMPEGYDGGLLRLAHDLGRRLLPAFRESPTGAARAAPAGRLPAAATSAARPRARCAAVSTGAPSCAAAARPSHGRRCGRRDAGRLRRVEPWRRPLPAACVVQGNHPAHQRSKHLSACACSHPP